MLRAERDDHANGRPLVYQPTPRLLQLLDVETLEEARGRLEVPADVPISAARSPESAPTAEYQGGSAGASDY